MKRSLLCILLAGSSMTLLADEPVRSMQEELRRRNIYFGDVDGRRTPELEEAVKRYQKRKGLPTTGSEDRETLRSLKLLSREPGEAPPRELAWPDEPVLKSDAKIDVAQQAELIAEETGVEAETVAPSLVALSPKERATAQSRTAVASRRRSTSTSDGGRTRSGGGGVAASGQRGALAQQITPKELSTFVRNYIRAIGRRDLQDELRFYADNVEYFGNGQVDRRIVERTLRDYYKRWPKRDFALGTPVRYQPDPARGEIVVSFEVKFTLKGTRGSVRGRTENQIVINAATADPRIVKIQERRVRG